MRVLGKGSEIFLFLIAVDNSVECVV
jgi:hypothetical protein